MSQHWRNVLLSLSAVTLLVTACKKTSSPDPSLTINYTPSIIISSDNYIVYGLNPVTGKKNWEYDGLHYPVQASPLIYNEMVYIATNGTDTIYKLNSKTGALVMKIVPDPNATFTVASTPIADNGLIYVAGSNSVLYAIDTGTGKPKWTYNTGTGVLADGTPIVSSPVIYNGKIYFATTGGGIYCRTKQTEVRFSARHLPRPLKYGLYQYRAPVSLHLPRLLFRTYTLGALLTVTCIVYTSMNQRFLL